MNIDGTIKLLGEPYPRVLTPGFIKTKIVGFLSVVQLGGPIHVITELSPTQSLTFRQNFDSQFSLRGRHALERSSSSPKIGLALVLTLLTMVDCLKRPQQNYFHK